MANQDEVLVKFKADTSDVIKGLNDVEQKTREYSNETVSSNNKVTQSYQSVKKEIRTLDNAYKTLQLAGRENGKVARGIANDLTLLKSKIDAVNASSIKSKSAFNGLGNSINQLSRELPAFTYSAQTGFLALSNNIPMLSDQITNLRKQNLDLVASGQKAIPIWKSLASAFLSLNTVISVGITLVTLYGKEIGNFITSLFSANKEIDKLARTQATLLDVQRKGKEEAVAEKVKLDLLIGTIKDENKGRKEKLEAVNELQKKYPSYFKDMTEEQILVSDLSKQYNDLSQNIIKRATAQVAYEKIVENEKRLLQLQIDLVEAQDKANSPQARDKQRNVLSGSGLTVIGKESNPLYEQAQANLKKIKNEIEAINFENKKLADNAGGLFSDPKNTPTKDPKEKLLGAYAELVKKISDQETKIKNSLVETGVVSDADLKRLKELQTELLTTNTVYDILQNGIAEVEDEVQKVNIIGKDVKTTIKGITVEAEKTIPVFKNWKDTLNETLPLVYDVLGNISQISKNIADENIANAERSAKAEIEMLDYKLEKKLISEEKYNEKKKKIEDKLLQESNQIRSEQAQISKQIAIFEAGIKGSVAIIEAFSKGPLVGALTSAAVLTQIATIASTPVPQFEKGGLIQGKSHKQGGVLIEAEGNEFIVNKIQTPKHMDVLEHINKGSFEEYNKRRYIIPALKKEREAIRQSIVNQFNDQNLLHSDQKNRELLREIRDALKSGSTYKNIRFKNV